MPKQRVFQLGGLNLKLNPLLIKEGDMIRSLNVENDLFGAKKKRPGYTTYLASIGGTVTSLFNWTQNDGSTFYNYAVSGGSLYYSTQGTGAWTICGNGTFTDNARLGYAVLENTLILGDGTAATRHTTSGTDFTNTTSAPIANYFTQFQNRIYAGGTSSNLFYSTTGTPTDWITDSTSLAIPGPGRINGVFKAADRVIVSKNSGQMFRWDGYTLADLATDLGPTSNWSIGNVEDYKFYLNRLGVFGFNGDLPELISNPIEKQIYNDPGEGITGGTFDSAPGIVHRYDYYASVGTVTDDLTDVTIPKALLKFDYQQNDWTNYEFENLPTAFGVYNDTSGNKQLIFGDATGQCYTFGGTNTTDNGATVEAVMEFVIHGGAPESDKKWNYCTFHFNPGNEAKVQVAAVDTFTKGKKNWVDLGDCSDGVAEFKPSGLRSKLLFVKIYEASRNARFQFLGFSYDFDVIEKK